MLKMSLKATVVVGLLAVGLLGLGQAGAGWFAESEVGSVVETLSTDSIPSLVTIDNVG